CERTVPVVPNCKGKHAVETTHCIPAPFGNCFEEDFGVAVGAKLLTEGAQLFAEFAVVVDLAVEREDVTTVVREHRLVTGGRCVDDREPSMAQAHAPSGSINRLRNPRPR